MKIGRLTDIVIRVAAAVVAVGLLPTVLFVSIMANDSGTPAGLRMSGIVLAVGSVLCLWVLLCSVAPGMVAGWLPGPQWIRIALVRAPSYAFGMLGIAALLSYAWLHLVLLRGPSALLAARNPQYPVGNPNPTHPLELIGTLPSEVPFKDFVATYSTDVDRTGATATSCGIMHRTGQKFLWYTEPFQVKNVIPITRVGIAYHAKLLVDQYLPGTCNWHLAEIHYNLVAPGFDSPGRTFGYVVVRNPAVIHDQPVGADQMYQGRIDVWCGKNLNKNITPYFPVVCGWWAAQNWKVPAAQWPFVPSDAMGSNEVVYVLPDTKVVNFSFHDSDAPVRKPVSAAAAELARECLKTEQQQLGQPVSTSRSDHLRRVQMIFDSYKGCLLKIPLPDWTTDVSADSDR